MISGVPAPNPQPGPVYNFALNLSGPSTDLELRIYSQAMIVLAVADLQGGWVQGWNQVKLDVPGLPNGLYYVVARTKTQGSARSKPISLMVIQ